MAGRCWNSTMCYACPCPSPSRNLVVRPKLRFQDIAEIAHNKVLIAAGVSAAIGQLSKPFISPEGDAKQFDFGAAVRSGGFPSTHSAAVVATATSLSFERGFSDSIFGLSVVYAALVMYDSQGVRREVGKHARVMNEALLEKAQVKSPSTKSDRVGKSSSSTMNLDRSGQYPIDGTERGSFNSKVTATPLMLKGDDMEEKELLLGVGDDGDTKSGVDGESGIRLKESVGHTEVEVLAGAILGFVTISLWSLKDLEILIQQKKKERGENRTRTDIRTLQDQGGIQVDMLQEKVPDATGHGGPVFGAAAPGKARDEEAEDKQKLDLGVTGTG